MPSRPSANAWTHAHFMLCVRKAEPNQKWLSSSSTNESYTIHVRCASVSAMARKRRLTRAKTCTKSAHSHRSMLTFRYDALKNFAGAFHKPCEFSTTQTLDNKTLKQGKAPRTSCVPCLDLALLESHFLLLRILRVSWGGERQQQQQQQAVEPRLLAWVQVGSQPSPLLNVYSVVLIFSCAFSCVKQRTRTKTSTTSLKSTKYQRNYAGAGACAYACACV